MRNQIQSKTTTDFPLGISAGDKANLGNTDRASLPHCRFVRTPSLVCECAVRPPLEDVWLGTETARERSRASRQLCLIASTIERPLLTGGYYDGRLEFNNLSSRTYCIVYC
jgi:hypothetical protein